MRYTTQPILFDAQNEEFVLYPSPANDFVNLDFISSTQGAKYSILNSAGQQLQTGILNEQHNLIDVRSFAPGNYFIQLTFENNQQYNRAFSKL